MASHDVASALPGATFVPDLRFLSANEASRARTELARLNRACGCEIGSLLSVTALAVYGAWIAVGVGSVGDVPVTIGVGVLVFSLGAVVGKQLGIAHAHHKRAVLFRELERLVGSPIAHGRANSMTNE